MLTPTFEPAAHNHVEDVIALTATLVDLGRAYARDGSVYFRSAGVAESAGSRGTKPSLWMPRAGPAGRSRQGSPARCRALAEVGGGGSVVGQPVGAGPARMARRVHGDGVGHPRSGPRPALRRRRPGLPAPSGTSQRSTTTAVAAEAVVVTAASLKAPRVSAEAPPGVASSRAAAVRTARRSSSRFRRGAGHASFMNIFWTSAMS